MQGEGRHEIGAAAAEAEINHGVPLFLDQLVDALRIGGAKVNADISRSAVLHGRDLLRQGFTVSQVVHDYGDVCQSITDLAMEWMHRSGRMTSAR